MSKGTASFLPVRFNIILSVILLVVLGLVIRVFILSILNQGFLRHEGDERVLRVINVPAFRGMIMDRNGFPLAVSTTVFSAWVNPQEFAPDKTGLKKLASLLNLNARDISALGKKHREFVYLKRMLPPAVAAQIRALNIRGVYLQQEYHRYYPEGEIMAHVIGFTNIDDQGQEGLELGFNKWLAGEPGKKWVIKDRLGQIIADMQTVREQKPGNDVTLSIDRRIQYMAYRELLAAVTQTKAASGSAVVLDVKTGEVLAMVNQPSYNPNNRAGKTTDTFRNRAVTDLFEPGSTIKAFTVAAALESGKFQPNSVIDTAPGWMRVDMNPRNVVRDEHNNGRINLGQILQHSSNMGATKLVLALPADNLWNMLNRVGFGEITGVGFPGEQPGVLVHHDPWGKFTLATLSFGYGLSVTALQLAHAYAVLANEGVKMPVSLLKRDHPVEGARVMDAKVAQNMLVLLESVLAKGGTAQSARIPGYSIAGKSGTSRKVGEEGYIKHYNSSFVGIGPVSDPRLVVAVVLSDPQGKNYLGGKVSAPVFAKIMEGTLRLLDVPPDEEKPA